MAGFLLLAISTLAALPQTVGVEIQVNTGAVDCSKGGNPSTFVQRMTGELHHRLSSGDGVYAGTLDFTATYRECLAECPDGACGGNCSATWQVEGKVPAEIRTYEDVPQIEIWFTGERALQSKLTGNTCPYGQEEEWGAEHLSDHYAIEATAETFPTQNVRTYKLWIWAVGDGEAPIGTIRLTPRSDELKAIVRAGSVPRGANVRLDGSASTGSPEQWTWTIAPRACPSVELPGGNRWSGPTAPEMTLDGPVVSFPLLCDADVTLEVRRGDEVHRSQPVLVRATPRPWKTEVGKTKQSTFGSELHGSPGGGTCLEFNGEFGRNVCAIDEASLPQGTEGRHWIHRDRTETQFASHPEGVVVEAVTDGPFRGWFYASRENLRIAREEQLHEDLARGGAVARLNGGAAEKFAAHTRAHEALHTKLAMQAFRTEGDPAPLVEQLVGENELALVSNINGAIFAVELAMAAASSEAAVAAELGPRPAGTVIVFPTAAGSTCQFQPAQ